LDGNPTFGGFLGSDDLLGLAWFGLVWLGLAWFGLVWLGLAWFGLAWLALALSMSGSAS